MKNKAITWIFAMVLTAAAMAISVSAGFHNPEMYWGYVYIENVIAPSGTVLTLESTNTAEIFANQTLPYSGSYPGSYSIMLNFDDTYTGPDEGADLNETLTWKVNGITATTPAAGADIAETGKTNNNFRIDAISTPSLSASIALSKLLINLTGSILLNVTLNNTGAGAANVTLSSLNDTAIITDLPKNTTVAKNNTNYTTVNITPAACGQQTVGLNINYYNILGSLIGTISQPFTFNVTGADLVLSSISLSDSTPAAGDTISIVSTLLNNGTVNITGFTANFYYDSTLIATINSNETIVPNSSIGLSANWVALLGATTIKVNFTTNGTECYSTNNYITTGVTVSAAVTPPPAGGGGGGGGGARAQCFDTRDNDGDGLIDYPNDPGCTSISDNEETDVIEVPGEVTPPEEVKPVEEKPAGIAAQFKKAVTDALTWFAIKIEKIGLKMFWIILLVYIILLLIYVPKIVRGKKKKEKERIKERIIYTTVSSREEEPRKEAAVKEKVVIKEKEAPTKIIIRPSEKPRVKVEVTTKHTPPKYIPAAEPKPVTPSQHIHHKEESLKPSIPPKHIHHKDISLEPQLLPPNAHQEKTQPKPTAPPAPPKLDNIHTQKQEHKGEHSYPGLRQKSIKISSKNEIIEKIKEVHKEND
jgi:hypothetical protein